MQDFWPGCGHRHLDLDERGWLRPTADWWRGLLLRPELAPVPESCSAETALHQALLDDPLRPVAVDAVAALADADARDNYGAWLGFRGRVLAASTLQGCYVALFRQPRITTPPVFIDLLVQCILRQLLDSDATAFEARAAETLFRPQRITLQDGHVLARDDDTLQRL